MLLAPPTLLSEDQIRNLKADLERGLRSFRMTNG